MRRDAKALAWVALAGAVLLQGCAVVPGMGSVEPYEAGGELPSQFRYLPDEAPEGEITPISLALVRTLAEVSPKGVPPEVQALFGKGARYTIGSGDVVGVIVYDHPELLPNAGAVISQSADPTGVQVAPGFIVDADGEIAFPYIGRVRVAGLSEGDASDLIGKLLRPHVRDPQVTVRIQSFRSRRAYVEGEVRVPGSQIFTDVPMTLNEAINRAGGMTANANRAAVTLIRDGRSVPIDMTRLREAGYDGNNIPLKNGDTVRVAHREDSKVFVMGEIMAPVALSMRSNGRLSLSEALGEAGGPMTTTSNAGQIYVIRQGATGAPAIFHLNAKNPATMALASQFRLQSQDVVYVDPVPLVKWNRVVSLILPSAQVVNNASEVYVRHR
ncbi:polysaccharide biosynthesis/export family protein [Variovorax sp. V35]|uniref:Polysaccharide export outer membrane protein n=2 Tax=Comamonadaceae TaxID=80864 RepID=A0AAW8E5R0_9BURK|nr:polysaccharide export outer membrane protein [Variovorax boronicumulans]MDP9926669.1 polysaccharide export outer membrane protein [Variovorax boronicumulans]PBI85499.1 Polysaccharide biosynthesis/export protein [Variovorax boronicumulans]GER12857.1 sugar transporter [Variovorax boronicumulans]